MGKDCGKCWTPQKMRSSRSVYVSATKFVDKGAFTNVPVRKRWLLAASLIFVMLLLPLVLRQSDPLSELAAAQTRWTALGISDYRIVVEYQRPFNTCQQDFKVQGDSIGYKYVDSCTLGAAAIGGNDDTLPTVARLFALIEDSLNHPQCGQNGCVCDGPVQISVAYDPQRGYPQHITYELRPDLRWRYLEYWLARLNGSLAQCPPTAYVGQTITVLSLETAPAQNAQSAAPGKSDEADKAPSSIGDAIQPESTP